MKISGDGFLVKERGIVEKVYKSRTFWGQILLISMPDVHININIGRIPRYCFSVRNR